jgi:hypothetical protein
MQSDAESEPDCLDEEASSAVSEFQVDESAGHFSQLAAAVLAVLATNVSDMQSVQASELTAALYLPAAQASGVTPSVPV